MTTSPAEPVPAAAESAAAPVPAPGAPAAETPVAPAPASPAAAAPTPAHVAARVTKAAPVAEATQVADPAPAAAPAAEAPEPPAAEAPEPPAAAPAAAAPEAAAGSEKTTDITAGQGGVMTDEVGVITGDLTLRSELSGGKVTVHVQYKDAGEWYKVTGAKATLKDPADLEAVHKIVVGILNRPEG